eukprot:Gregarina_sp_Pseudo_9__3962@NODE_4105_length_485_cov_303_000000_g3776_i0_p1_GENE_NODE_4105_length_485_cov_303_000000_g3776_i0NODE_4105_length_485_cov_303_000000_g3776_i0_p1_ORF_typecomplete_len142_score20_66NTF2/PF02136_20/3_7e22Mtr2/PF10429_9/0_016DUF4518/PF15008_6/0_01_NODE_4105_length_485_cov_303_000000_g3776_i060434
MALDVQTLATQFLENYYAALSSNRACLATFYNDNSTLNWEQRVYKGTSEIGECFGKMSAGGLQFPNIEKEVQITPGNGVLILVTGHVTIDGGSPIGFSQVFLLMPTQEGGWYINNEVFKFAFAG